MPIRRPNLPLLFQVLGWCGNASGTLTGTRTIAASDFFVYTFTPALEPDEMLTEVWFPELAARAPATPSWRWPVATVILRWWQSQRSSHLATMERLPRRGSPWGALHRCRCEPCAPKNHLAGTARRAGSFSSGRSRSRRPTPIRRAIFMPTQSIGERLSER